MPAPEELQGDKDFMSATPADQIKYLSETDQDFKAAHPDDQAAYLAHVTKQPTGAEAMQPKPGITGKLDTATDYISKGLEPVDKAVTEALAPKPTGDILPTETREVPKAAARNIYGAGKTALKTLTGLPSALGHAFGDEATPEEKAQYSDFEKQHGERPGAETSGMKRIGLGVQRFLGADQIKNAVDTYSNPATRPTAEQALSVAEPAIQEGAGTVLGMEAAGKLAGIPSAKTMPATADMVGKGVRGLGKAYQATREVAPEAGAAIGGTLGAVKGPGGAAYGMYIGGRVGKILQKITPEGNAAAEFGLSTEDRNVQRLEKAVTTADKAADKAAQDHSIYAASEERGPIDPAVNPAYKKSMEALKKAKDAQAEAHFHLQEAKRAAQEAEANKGASEGQGKDITPEEVAAARPEPATPTNEELNARQEKLMSDMEKQAGIEKPAATPENVKTPGQVQPETVPQTPEPAPRVDETTQMRPLAGNKGVIVGRPPRLLGEGTPEVAPAASAAPEAPKTPLGEILPPEKPAKPGRLGSLKVSEGGKIVDTEPEVQQKIEEGLRKGSAEAKPVALKSLAAREAEELAKIKPIEIPPEYTELTRHRLGVPAETSQDFGSKVRAEAPPMPRGERRARVRTPEEQESTELFRQARKELGEDATNEQIDKRLEELKSAKSSPASERTPEDLSKVKKLMADHTDQELLREAQRRGIDESQYDLSKREGPNRHRVDRDRLVNDLVDKIPEDEKDKLVDLSDKFDSKDDSTWTNAEKSNLNRAQRARAIMQEHTGGSKGYGESNKLVTEEAKDAAVKALNDKLTRSNAGFDPTAIADAAKIGAYHLEAGVRAFSDWSEKMVNDLGEAIRPHLEEIWKSISSGGGPGTKEAWQRLRETGKTTLDNAPAERGGSEESSAKDREHFAQAKRELPNGTISEQLLRAQELKEKTSKPVDVAKAADDYNKSQGLPAVKHEKLEKSPRSAEIGKAYDEMEHTPDDEATKKSYNALIDDTKKQWDYATKEMGINIVPTDEDPYKSHEEMMDDLKNNKRLKVYRGGTPLEEGHNLGAVDPKTGENYNTMFRAVHDIFGHAAQGHDFSEGGEESAWNTHRQMMSPEAVPAMTTETRAQTSSFFKNGGKFPEQKNGILPDFAMEKGEATDHSKAIADLHNEGGGSTYNPTKGDMGGADAYAVPMHPELSRSVEGEKVTPEQIKKFMELPEVKKAMDANPDLSVGTWANDGKTYLDLSATIPDKSEAVKLGKENNQKAITYLKTREDIPTGGTGTGTPLEPKPLDQNPEVKAVQDMKEEANKPKDGLLNKAYRAYSQSSFSGEEGKVNLGDKGIAKAMPTGDQLIKKYGESSGDPAHTAFILPDGRGVALGAVDHDTMLGGKATDKVPRRDQFVDSGNIRIRPRTGGKAGREFSISIPESGITEDQLAHLNKMAPQLSSGTVMVEIGKRGGDYKSIPYGEASKSLESTLRDLAPIKNSKGSPIDEFGNPTVSGGSQGAGTAKAKESLDFIKENANVLPRGKVDVETINDYKTRHFLLSDGSMISEKVPIHSDIEGMVGGKNLQAAKAIRMAGPQEFSIYYEPTTQQVSELSRITRAANEEYGGKVYWTIKPKTGGDIGGAGSFGDFQRDLDKAYSEKSTLGDLAEKHLTPEERQGVTKSPQQQSRFIQRMEQMPEVQEWTDAAKKGAGERKWYQRGTQAFDAMSKEAPEYFDQPGDRDKFIGMLASGSPQQSVAMNMREALRVWTNYVDNGRPTGAKLEKLLSEPSDQGGFTLPGAKIPNTMKALAGEPLWPDITKNKNFKVPSFRDNLTGVLDKVTNDGWMALFSGLDARDVSSAHSYHPISVMTRAAADELGWEPAEAQAAIWAFIKTLTEKGVDASEDPHEMRQYSEDFADIILHDPETRNLLKDMGVDHAKLDERLAREVEGKPEPKPGEISPTGEDSSRRAIERVEKARGKGTIPPPKTGLLKFGEPEPDASTSFKPEEFKSGDNTVKEHTYEYSDSGTLKHVTARDAEGKSVATVVATPEDNDPNTWTVGFSAATETGKGIGLGAYAKLADEAKAEAERTGKTVTLQGDKPAQMSAAARRTWAKMGEQGYDVRWSKNNRPSIVMRGTGLKKLGASAKPSALGKIEK